jgi:GxxExxY protein
MRLALAEAGLVVSPKRPLEVWFRGQVIGIFEPDIIVDEAVSVELKAGRSIDSAHEAQLLNYLRASTIEVGLLFNFGRNPEFKRLVFDNDRKHRALTGGHNRDGGATSAP